MQAQNLLPSDQEISAQKGNARMGIRFVDSILALLTAVCGVLVAYFVGHGLSEMTAWPWITAAVLLVAAFLLGVVTVRRVREYARQTGGVDGHAGSH
jgi:uncharacterized membrane protein (DUF441 family)